MCVQKILTHKSVQIFSMNPSKKNLSVDDQDNPSINQTSTTSDVDSPTRSYALIETDPDELDHIVDLLRQFFPKTKIIEYNQRNTSQQQSFENDDQISSNTNSQTFKGKVKDYLQRRYLEQTSENLTKSRDTNLNSFDIPSSSIINKRSKTSKSRSLDSSLIQIENSSHTQSPSKRRFLQRYTTIDMDESSNDTEKTIFNIDESDDVDDDVDDEVEEDEGNSKSFRHPYSEQQTKTKPNHFLLPYPHSTKHEHEQNTSPFPNTLQLPIPPYSASSDPGPYRSPWLHTPTSTFNFRFSQGQEQLATNIQSSIAQLSTLTKMLCDQPSVYTPISPRIKEEKHDTHPSKDSSSIPTCQICRQEFESHQMYLTHYRRHLENSCEDNKSDILDSDINCDRSGDIRNYSCNICSKRFSRSDMLNRHLRLHSGVRPYRCTLCNTHFSRSDHLSTHLRTHTGEKPYTCPQCSYSACRRDMITRHLKIHRKKRSERKNATSTFASSNDP